MNDYVKVYLDVPFVDKDKAKGLGARWDGELKQWYCPEVNKELFAEWFEKGDKPERDLRVVDEATWQFAPVHNPKLYIDLIPETAWCTNLRSGLEAKDWDLVRKAVYRFGKYICEVCKGVGSNHPVEAHERFEYDVDNLVQRLVGISCLCPACHQSTHYGLANIKGLGAEAGNHLKSVNKWTDEELNEHIDSSFNTWKFRSEFDWKLDISWLLDRGIQFTDKTNDNIEHTGDYWTFKKHVIKNKEE
ncbi:DUF5710 domain-containing protein [Methylovorus glucosotrophus]|uniref:DUF5710 domain-containing protein n=1 Tax=Methylovorus glucosotrophus (strain SIP3-4) TaxID=582744 RepID=C6X7Z4_METGS|nr:DUF5710 domain-containing protein [Methylovorus glucosotrophus]ACT51321.1 conserved hypothetical protein [Methylovorus glucosotrophus SIP3-4]